MTKPRFVKKYENKSFTEIEPIELREKIINTFASINSNVRNGHREYNEMYISNPNKVSGVFAYSKNIQNELGNPIDFLNNKAKYRTEFLRQYALERDIPFVIFGD